MESRANPASVHQIITEANTAASCTATKWVWVSQEEDQHFAGATSGNTVKPFTTGKAYYANLLAALDTATTEVLIAGWQVNWDAMLAPGVRLFDALLKVAKRGKGDIRIVVMPWDDSAPVQTFDDQTKSVFALINEVVGKDVVWVHEAKSLADVSVAFFSHHQKQVVIDQRIAFVGGIDVAYGRYDDARYTLQADADGREVLNRYNGCVAQMGQVNPDRVVDPDRLTGNYDNHNTLWGLVGNNREAVTKKILHNHAMQVPYVEDGFFSEKGTGSSLSAVLLTLDPKLQPRMPWQDIHCRIEGPAVSDLARNFIQRWNAQAPKHVLAMPKKPDDYQKPGKCQVQVLRSASSGLRQAEVKGNRQIPKGVKAQTDILQAMVELIKKSQHFIYIENQFFVGAFGHNSVAEVAQSPMVDEADSVEYLDQKKLALATTAGGGRASMNDLPANPICGEVAMRIDIAIRTKQEFHVLITLPVHPEGPLNSGAIMTQVHWTMQTLVFGDFSLLNRIRRSLASQKLRDKKDVDDGRVYSASNTEYLDIPIEECFKYVTLLNLRNWIKLNDRYVTEQIYVHSKLMIVDDRYVIMGSANINDRSLLGTRDSELAVLIVDDEIERKDICGNGKLVPVRKFAHELRREVWSKIFGITGNVRPATELQAAIEHPASPKSWKAIQRVAATNASLYEAAFGYIPRNKDPNDPGEERTASIWPVWDKSKSTKGNAARNAMPFESRFWSARQHFAAGVAGLEKIRGFITALPIEWTTGENNNLGYHTALVVKNTQPVTAPNMSERIEIAALNNPKIDDET
ncbi:phospholipase D-like domain-containing protein [Massilia sp. TWP1-3-3]|uniref:phospholipase D-like domain-containing protein n=1 Tax=Massilia sp. TWP1-3-3 TaxID=2804573 RepID=UPI003CEDAFA0